MPDVCNNCTTASVKQSVAGTVLDPASPRRTDNRIMLLQIAIEEIRHYLSAPQADELRRSYASRTTACIINQAGGRIPRLSLDEILAIMAQLQLCYANLISGTNPELEARSGKAPGRRAESLHDG